MQKFLIVLLLFSPIIADSATEKLKELAEKFNEIDAPFLDEDTKNKLEEVKKLIAEAQEIVEKEGIKKSFLETMVKSLEIENKRINESSRSNRIKVQQQKIFNKALQMQYDKMWQDLRKEFNDRNMARVYQRAQVLEKNFNIFEITIKYDNKFKILNHGKEHLAGCNSEEELSNFFQQVIPRSVQIDPSKSIFLVLMEPESVVSQRTWVEDELRKMKVIYDVHLLAKAE